jgi:hypothetical protein
MKVILLILVSLFSTMLINAQHGGKAEPGRIQFAKGKTSAVIAGSLRSSEEAEYVFAARAGQMVTIRNPSRAFDFRVFSDENFPDGDFDSSPSYSFEIPADGDYNFFVRRKVGGPRRASYRMTLTIK